jgi:hypothetical protein
LLKEDEFDEICKIEAQLLNAALVSFQEANWNGEVQAAQFATAMEIWYILGKTMVNVMDYKKAPDFLLRADDAATHMRMQKLGDLESLLKISMYSLQKLTEICLKSADQVLETKLFTFKYAYPLMAELNKRCKDLSSYPEIAKLNMPKIHFLAAWAFKNVRDLEKADSSLQNLLAALEYLKHVDQAKFFVGEVHWKFMNTHVKMQQKNFEAAIQLCGQVIHQATERSICAPIVVEAYFLATEIDIAHDYDLGTKTHGGFTRAEDKLKGARTYLDRKEQELKYHLPSLDHRFDQLKTELRLRHAVFLHSRGSKLRDARQGERNNAHLLWFSTRRLRPESAQ